MRLMFVSISLFRNYANKKAKIKLCQSDELQKLHLYSSTSRPPWNWYNQSSSTTSGKLSTGHLQIVLLDHHHHHGRKLTNRRKTHETLIQSKSKASSSETRNLFYKSFLPVEPSCAWLTAQTHWALQIIAIIYGVVGNGQKSFIVHIGRAYKKTPFRILAKLQTFDFKVSNDKNTVIIIQR